MARRDVDLVIKAKDDAAKVVDRITKALNDFQEGTKKLDQGAERSGNALADLGAAIAKIDKALTDTSGAEKLGTSLDQAAKSLARLESKMEATEATVRGQEQALKRASAETERYTAKMTGANAALDRQKAAVAQAKRDQKSLAAAQSESAAAVDKLASRQSKLPAQIEKQSAAVQKARSRYEQLAQSIKETEAPSQTLRNQFEASERSVTKKTARLQQLQSELNQVEGELRAASSAVAIFGGRSEQAARNMARQEAVLEKIGQNYTNLKQQVSSSAGVQKKLQKELSDTNNELAKQGGALQRAEKDYVDLAESVGKADAALSQFADSSLAELSGQLRRQKRATLEAKREWKGAEARVKELAQATRAAVAPSEELNRAFREARANAATAKQQYQLNRVALHEIGQASRGAGRDMQSLQAASAKVAASQERLSNSLQQTAQRTQRVSNETRRTDQVMRRHTSTVSRLAAAYQQFYGDTRRSLSLLQRIRGEVLSLVAAYGGLFAAIEVIRGTVQATQTLAGVTARLKAAFGSEANATKELEFLRREADRLGVSFVNLANEYSKFAVATQGTNLEGQATRDIFRGVAEAARVNRSSQEELQGVFVALTQIVSKGAVQMEELRQQLGDRLPGAVRIMADSLNIGTDELVKMMEQGQITADALVPFAKELQERFGPGLEESLESTAASIGRLSTAAFNAMTLIGESGFIEGFQRLVDQMTETLNSAQFESFAERVGAAMGQLFEMIAFGVENFDILIAAISAFLGLRLTPFVIAGAGALGQFATQAVGAVAALRGVSAAGATTTSTMYALGAAVGRLRIAFLALLGTTGIGLVVAAIAAGLSLWATSTKDATEALSDHRDMVDSVRKAYDDAGGSVDKWAKAINGVTFSQAVGNFERLRQELQSAREEATDFNVGRDDSVGQQVKNLITLFREGGISADAYKRALEEIAEADPTVSRSDIARLQDAADETKELARATDEAQAQMILLNENSSDAAKEVAKEVLGLGAAFDEAAEAATAAAKKAERYEKAMSELRDRIPQVKRELDFLEESTAIEGFLQQSIQAASTWGEIGDAIRAAGQAQKALNKDFAEGISGLSGASSGAEAAAAILRDSEGFTPTPQWDVNAFRAGYGSDTITLADQTVKAVTKGMRVSVEDANRDLLRRINREFLPSARNEIGASRFDALTPQQQGVLTSITYNFGNLPDSVAEAVRSGMSDSGIAQTIRNLGARGLSGTKYEDGARKRSNEEAALFESGVGIEQAIKRQEQQAEQARRERERAAEERAEQAEATSETIANNDFALEQQRLKNEGLERQAVIEKAIRDAKAENPNIAQRELDVIARQAGALFDKQQAEKQILTTKEKAQQAEARVNQILQQRQALEAQRDLAMQSGEVDRATELTEGMMALNDQLRQAIDNAIRMWEAVGGGASETAIAQLRLARDQASKFGQDAQDSYIQWDRVGNLLQTGLTNAAMNFAKAIGEGKTAGEAARQAFLQFASDFLIQIGKMIVQQAILNALKAAFGGSPFGALMGFGAGHTGGLVGSTRVGSGNRTRRVDPSVFTSASRYHSGGMIGLAPNEVPIIAKKGEEMLTEDDPRHMLNGGGKGGDSGGKKRPLSIINAFDSSDVLEQAAASQAGSDVLMNFIRSNRDTIRAELDE